MFTQAQELETWLSEYEAKLGGWHLEDDEKASLIDLPLSPGKLYLGGFGSLNRLKDGMKMDVVISMCKFPDQHYSIPLSKVTHHEFPIDDDYQEKTLETMRGYLIETEKIIDAAIKEKKRVLVHCAAGMSRSATVVLYYILKQTEGISARVRVERALRYVKTLRPCIFPNRGFLVLLLEAAAI